jgi:transcriptional regulator with XRE-family HTH domain
MSKSIKELRISKGIKAIELGEYIGFTKAQMSYVETQKMLPTVADAIKGSQLLKCKPREFYPTEELLNILTDRQNRAKGKKETLFGLPVRKIQFRVNSGGFNLLELAVKQLGCTDKHDLYRRFIEPYIIHKIELSKKRTDKQKEKVKQFTEVLYAKN